VDTTSIPAGASPNPPVPAASTAATEFSVQIAAYNARADATSLFNRLKQRGFDVRVVGDRAPYRVRIGRYATRAEAVAALGRMRAAQVNGIVVEAERR
jgi:cell division protein FtsN